MAKPLESRAQAEQMGFVGNVLPTAESRQLDTGNTAEPTVFLSRETPHPPLHQL